MNETPIEAIVDKLQADLACGMSEETIKEDYEKMSMELDWVIYNAYEVLKEVRDERNSTHTVHTVHTREILKEALDFAERKSVIVNKWDWEIIKTYARWVAWLDKEDDEREKSMVCLIGWIILYHICK